MEHTHKLLYLFRGWIAFVAFMDFGTAFRAFIERRSFLGDTSTSMFVEGDFTVSRILGMYLLLKAICLVHCTLYIHYKATVSMAGFALILTLLFYLSEALYFRTCSFDFYVIFPTILNSITLVGILYIPKKLRIWEPMTITYPDDENAMFLKKMNGFKKRRKNQSSFYQQQDDD